MTDIHSHILPGIDDGAKDINESLALLRAEIADGVDTVVLTPHFRANSDDLARFLQRRQKAYEALMNEAAGMNVKLLLGAEVRFSAELAQLDVTPLCTDGKSCLLIELPTSHYPILAQDVFYDLTLKGIKPVIAHIERYRYLMGSPYNLEDLLLSGALAQINADSLFRDRRTRKTLLNMIDDDKVHIIASDAHSIDSRPPMLGKAMALVEKKLGGDVVERLEQNAERTLNYRATM